MDLLAELHDVVAVECAHGVLDYHDYVWQGISGGFFGELPGEGAFLIDDIVPDSNICFSTFALWDLIPIHMSARTLDNPYHLLEARVFAK